MRCVKDFLQFYTFQAPLLCFTTFWSDLPSGTEDELHLRGSGEHTHFWQEEGASFLAILAVIFSSFMSGWTAWSAGRAPPGAEVRLIQF